MRNTQNLVDKWKKINTQQCNWAETFVDFMKESNVLPSILQGLNWSVQIKTRTADYTFDIYKNVYLLL